jgi:hypothetical protein
MDSPVRKWTNISTGREHVKIGWAEMRVSTMKATCERKEAQPRAADCSISPLPKKKNN